MVDTATHAVRGTIPIDDGPPQYVAFSREQNSGQNTAVNRVVVVDTLRGGVVASIPVGTRPSALAVTPDPTRSEVWVPNHDAASVSIIDTATNTVTTTLPVAPNPHWVAFSPDGTFAYTANHESNLITVLDVATKTVVGQVRVGSSPRRFPAQSFTPGRICPREVLTRRPLRLQEGLRGRGERRLVEQAHRQVADLDAEEHRLQTGPRASHRRGCRPHGPRCSAPRWPAARCGDGAPGSGCGAAARRRPELPARSSRTGRRSECCADRSRPANLDDDRSLRLPAWWTVTAVCWRPASRNIASTVCGRTNPPSSPRPLAGPAAPPVDMPVSIRSARTCRS